MDRSRELNNCSVTLTVSNTHVPEQWFVAYALFLDQVIFRTGGTGFVAQETGRRKQQIHLQSGIRARATGTTGAKELHDYLCEHVCLWVAGRKLRVTPYGPGQNMLAMAGYCMKDKGKSHYRFHSVNFTTDDLERAMRQYALVRTSYEYGKRMLSKRNAMTMAWKEVRSYPLRLLSLLTMHCVCNVLFHLDLVLFHLPSRAICSPGQARLDPSVRALPSRPCSHAHVYASTLCHCLSLCLPVEPLRIPRLAWPTRHSDVADTACVGQVEVPRLQAHCGRVEGRQLQPPRVHVVQAGQSEQHGAAYDVELEDLVVGQCRHHHCKPLARHQTAVESLRQNLGAAVELDQR